jgi:hypothetical protein
MEVLRMIQFLGPTGTRLRRALPGAILFAMLASLVVTLPALAVHDTGRFQLDGDASSATQPVGPSATDDWDKVCHQYAPAGTTCSTALNTTDSTSGLWTNDGSLNASIFTGGGSKDPQDISNWAWKDGAGGLPDKDNLLHAFAVRYSLPPATTCPSSGASTCEVIYFGSDRLDNSGDAQQGFWFLQNKVALGSNNVGGGSGFTGVHKLGDILVVSDFSNGGTTSTITVYSWDPTVSGNLRLLESSTNANCSTVSTGDSFCGIVNPVTITMPWSFTDKSGTPNNGALNGEFYEAGINLSAIGLGGECFSNMVAETRSSTSTTATLKDFVLGTFGGCTAHMTTQASNNGTVLPGVAVHDTANLSVTGASSPPDPTGTVTFFLCKVAAGADCSSNGTNVGTGVLNGGTNLKDGIASAISPNVNDGASGALVPGHYCFRAEWPGDVNYPGAATFTDGSLECFEVAKLPTTTVTTPSSATITLTDSITDTAVVTGTAAGGDPTGTVNFFVCGPMAAGTCAAPGGTAVAGNPKTLVADSDPNTYTSSATSGLFTPGAVGRYCFRAEYGGSLVYDPSSDSGANECFTVNDTSSITSAQTWLPNDSGTVTSTNGAPLLGSLSFTLHAGLGCTGAVLRPAESFSLLGTSSAVTKSTTNSTVSVTTTQDVSWEVVFASDNSNVSGSSKCENSSLTITNNP